MLKKPASIVLASLRGSTYRNVRFASSLAAALLDGHFEHPVDKWPSQQFYSGLDDFHSGDAPNQIQRLVTHLIDESSFISHAGKPQYGLLPQILSIDLGYGEIELFPQSIFKTQQYLPFVL